MARNGQKSNRSETEVSLKPTMEVSSNQMNLSNFAGIRREYTTPYSPEQNGIAERMNQTIQERAVSMLKHSGLSDGLWAEALLTAEHIINMSPSRHPVRRGKI